MFSNPILSQNDPNLINYKNILINELNDLAFIMFDNGNKKCSNRPIGEILKCIRAINKKHPEYSEEQNKIIKANARYESLYETFPKWRDVNNIQQQKKLKLVNNMEVSYGQYHPECNMM